MLALLATIFRLVLSSDAVSALMKEHDQLMRSFAVESLHQTNLLKSNKTPAQVLELDVHLKPVGAATGALALLHDGKYSKQ